MAHSHNKRHGGYRGHNKPKDLVGTWKKLLGYCRRYLAVFMIAILCAAAGTVLTLIGPDKLSEMTDTITAGITPNTEALTELTEAVSENASANMQEVSTAIAANLQSSTPKAINVNGSEISLADQRQTLSLLAGLSDPDAATMQETMAQLPDAVTAALYSDVTIDGQTISAADQRAAMEIMSGIDPEESEDALEAMDKLPDSVYSLIAPSIDMDKVQRIGFILVTFYALSYLFSAIQGWITAGVTQRVSQQLRGDISRKINRLPMAFYNRTSTGDILSRVTNDVDLISQSLNQSIGNLITSVILLFGSLLMMLITNLWMTLTAILASLLGFVVMFAIMGRSQKYFARQQRHLGALNGHIEEMYTGHTVVKAYNGEAAAQQTFDEMNDKLRESGFRAQTLAGMMMPVMTFVGNLGYVAVCVVGGAMALNDMISFGVIVAFMMYVRYFTQPLSQIAQAVQSLQSAAAAGERVFEFLEAEEMPEKSGKKADLGAVQGTVDFDHVRFGYEDTDKIVIHDFSAHAKPGQKIAIVGPTGAGKRRWSICSCASTTFRAARSASTACQRTK